MSILRRAAAVFARLIAMGRHEEASALLAVMPARKNRRGRKYPPAIQVRGGLCTIGSHDAAMRAALIERAWYEREFLPWPEPNRGRCDRSPVYKETLAELGVRQ